MDQRQKAKQTHVSLHGNLAWKIIGLGSWWKHGILISMQNLVAIHRSGWIIPKIMYNTVNSLLCLKVKLGVSAKIGVSNDQIPTLKFDIHEIDYIATSVTNRIGRRKVVFSVARRNELDKPDCVGYETPEA